MRDLGIQRYARHGNQWQTNDVDKHSNHYCQHIERCIACTSRTRPTNEAGLIQTQSQSSTRIPHPLAKEAFIDWFIGDLHKKFNSCLINDSNQEQLGYGFKHTIHISSTVLPNDFFHPVRYLPGP